MLSVRCQRSGDSAEAAPGLLRCCWPHCCFTAVRLPARCCRVPWLLVQHSPHINSPLQAYRHTLATLSSLACTSRMRCSAPPTRARSRATRSPSSCIRLWSFAGDCTSPSTSQSISALDSLQVKGSPGSCWQHLLQGLHCMLLMSISSEPRRACPVLQVQHIPQGHGPVRQASEAGLTLTSTTCA